MIKKIICKSQVLRFKLLLGIFYFTAQDIFYQQNMASSSIYLVQSAVLSKAKKQVPNYQNEFRN